MRVTIDIFIKMKHTLKNLYLLRYNVKEEYNFDIIFYQWKT